MPGARQSRARWSYADLVVETTHELKGAALNGGNAGRRILVRAWTRRGLCWASWLWTSRSHSRSGKSSLMRSDLPSGTVTFLFTDVEGSTRLLHELGAEA